MEVQLRPRMLCDTVLIAWLDGRNLGTGPIDLR